MIPAFLVLSRTAVAMCGAGVVLLVVSLWAARGDIGRGRGGEKV